MNPKTRAAANNLDPTGKPEQPVPWYQLDPEKALDPWGELAPAPPVGSNRPMVKSAIQLGRFSDRRRRVPRG